MVVLNFRDGRTEKFNLADTAEARRLNGIGNDPQAASRVSGLWLKIDERSTTLPIPKRFRRVSFFGESLIRGDGEHIGERLVIQADDIEVSATMWTSGSMTKIETTKTGRRVWAPLEDGQ